MKLKKGTVAKVYDLLLTKPERTKWEQSLTNILGTITNMRPSCNIDEDEKNEIVVLTLLNEQEIEAWDWLSIYCL